MSIPKYVSEYAPIALFVFNRPEHTRKTIEALAQNPGASDSDLIIFSDAARLPTQEKNVEIVREYLHGILGFRSVKIYLRDVNYGLSKSIISGVTEILKRYDKVIVLEDDIVVSPYFLAFMNDALAMYAQEDRVASIHGYVPPVDELLPETFFLRGADCWGWATWSRSWINFNDDGEYLLRELKDTHQMQEFDLNGAYPFSKMLEDQIRGKNDSWAIRWHATCFLNNKFTLYPGSSLVANIGQDGTGTHCHKDSNVDMRLSSKPINLIAAEIRSSPLGRMAFESFFRKHQTTFSLKVKLGIKKLLKMRA